MNKNEYNEETNKYYDSQGECPRCGSTRIKKVRIPYCGPNDTNYLNCNCSSCGYYWEEID